MAMNVSIEQCANCGYFFEGDNDYIIGFLPIGDVYGSTIERMIGYCCSLCGYFEEV